MVQEFSIDEASRLIVNLLGSDNFVLIAMILAFWILFYGIFTLAIKKAPFVGDDPSHLKLAKIISGTLSAIIVLSSLAFTPPGGMIEYAKQIASRFNFLFAVILSILIFFLFKGLLNSEDKKVQYYGGFWGLIISFYLFGTLAPDSGLASIGRTFGTLGFFVLILTTIIYFGKHLGGFKFGSGSSGGGGDWTKKFEELEDMDDEKKKEKKFKDLVDEEKEEYKEKVEELEDNFKTIYRMVDGAIQSLSKFIHRLDKKANRVRRSMSGGYYGRAEEYEGLSEEEKEQWENASKRIHEFETLKETKVEALSYLFQTLYNKINQLDRRVGKPKDYPKKAKPRKDKIDDLFIKIETSLDNVDREYMRLAGETNRDVSDPIIITQIPST